MKRVCVFCGSKHGVRPGYTESARSLAQTLVKHNIGLVYGGEWLKKRYSSAAASAAATTHLLTLLCHLPIGCTMAVCYCSAVDMQHACGAAEVARCNLAL
jgi:hypothetical protein